MVDALADVIEWHQQGLLPLGKQLTIDPRCRFDAILVDIDHSPNNLLHPRHAALYEPEGLVGLARHLNPGGVFALWSNDPPDAGFERAMARAFALAHTRVVTFDNPLQLREASNTVYVGVKAGLTISNPMERT